MKNYAVLSVMFSSQFYRTKFMRCPIWMKKHYTVFLHMFNWFISNYNQITTKILGRTTRKWLPINTPPMALTKGSSTSLPTNIFFLVGVLFLEGKNLQKTDRCATKRGPFSASLNMAPPHDCKIAITVNRRWYTKSKIGNRHAMYNQILHGMTIADCFFCNSIWPCVLMTFDIKNSTIII